MSDDIFARFYTTTAAADDRRVSGGCGHLHARAAQAVACALEGGGFPVAVDRAGKTILRMDKALDAALAAAVGTSEGGGSHEARHAG